MLFCVNRRQQKEKYKATTKITTVAEVIAQWLTHDPTDRHNKCEQKMRFETKAINVNNETKKKKKEMRRQKKVHSFDWNGNNTPCVLHTSIKIQRIYVIIIFNLEVKKSADLSPAFILEVLHYEWQTKTYIDDA